MQAQALGRASVIDAADATMTRAIRGAERPSSRASGAVMRAITLGGGILLSLLFHGSVLATFLYLAKHKPGAIEQPTEAISVASLQSDVLEAVSAAQSAAAVSASSVDETVGEIKESAAAQPSQAREFEPDEPHTVPAATEVRYSAVQPEGLDLVRGELVSERSAGDETGAADVTAEAGAPERNVREQSASRKPRTPSEARPNHDRSSQRKQKGAASVRAKSGAQASAGRVSASSGSALNYAALVRARVAGRRPGGNGGRGTVVVAFSVSRAGALNSARIARSSGNSSLDSSVLAAVRGAGPFPPPPATANLSFSMPFYFK